MNSPLNLLRGTVVALAAAFALTGSVVAVPKKPEPAAATQPAPAPEKKGMFTRAKEMIGLKKKEQPAPQPAADLKAVPKAKPAAESKPAVKSAAPKSTPVAKAKPAEPAKPAKKVQEPAVAEVKPEKKGWIKGLFSKSKDDAPAEPTLAKAKTAKPAPVKEMKPAKSDETFADAEEPKEKRGIFGFFRRLREPIPEEDSITSVAETDLIERPDDWQEHKVVREDGIALYTFGPSQANGPDKRLDTGAVVKVKSVKRGYALVQVPGGITGYMDAAMLRDAEKSDFRDPVPAMASLGLTPDNWAPLAPPPDLPDQPSPMDAEAALLLLPPLEPKPNP